jgi:hypothetical protein
MPCRYDPTPSEIEASRVAASERQKTKERRLRKDLDKLTADNDRLRETVVELVNRFPEVEDFVGAEVFALIEKDQIEHRKADLARLQRVFTANKDATRLGIVMLADPTKALDPQLGFSPDDF